jgi:hypothetical protein
MEGKCSQNRWRLWPPRERSCVRNALRPSERRPGFRCMRALLVLLSLIPHLYVATVGLREAGPSGFLLGVLAWSLVPVAIGARMAYSQSPRFGVGWLLTTLASSTWAVWVGLLRPQGSTGGLIFLFLPLWNLALVGPAGVLLALLWSRYAGRRARAA